MPRPSPKQFESLDDLRERLESTDLIPSQEPLREQIAERFALLSRAGIETIANLQASLKGKRSIEPLAELSGVDPEYLVLLRRAVNGFHPKPRPLREFDWVPLGVVTALEEAGVKNSTQLHDAAQTGLADLVKRTGVSQDELSELVVLSGLVRVQWVSPTFARALVAAGFPTPEAVRLADPDQLHEAVVAANEGARYFRGTVGLRDIRRLVDAAAYV